MGAPGSVLPEATASVGLTDGPSLMTAKELRQGTKAWCITGISLVCEPESLKYTARGSLSRGVGGFALMATLSSDPALYSSTASK